MNSVNQLQIFLQISCLSSPTCFWHSKKYLVFPPILDFYFFDVFCTLPSRLLPSAFSDHHRSLLEFVCVGLHFVYVGLQLVYCVSSPIFETGYILSKRLDGMLYQRHVSWIFLTLQSLKEYEMSQKWQVSIGSVNGGGSDQEGPEWKRGSLQWRVSHTRLKGWTDQIDVFEFDKAIIPCNLNINHSVTAVIDNDKERIEILDKFGGENVSLRRDRQNLLRCLKEDQNDNFSKNCHCPFFSRGS